MLKAENRACDWVKKTLKQENIQCIPLAGDASFRRYYRIMHQGRSLILMDAPPEKEPLDNFIDVAARLKKQGLVVPEIFYHSKALGLALLEDFGDLLFLTAVKKEEPDQLYTLAIEQLVCLQQTVKTNLPEFNALFIRHELQLFTDWFLGHYLQLRLSNKEQAIIQSTFDYLCTKLMQQPQVFIHRDYHSRNLMLVPNRPLQKLAASSQEAVDFPKRSNGKTTKLGILDFQDAMQGPFTYDLASLLKDCYIQWPEDKIKTWISTFYMQSPLAQRQSLDAFTEDFALCGLQRHLKVLGIFARLALRDQKRQYLDDLPLTLHYVLAYLETNPILAPFYNFLQQRVRLA